jgi:hypothetical protein
MAAVRRKVVDYDDAQELLDDWEASGMDFRAFCARVGVDGRSLQCWRQNLGRREAPAAGPRLVELVRPAPGGEIKAAATYRVVVGDIAVEVGDAFRDDTLTRLLAVVVRC